MTKQGKISIQSLPVLQSTTTKEHTESPVLRSSTTKDNVPGAEGGDDLIGEQSGDDDNDIEMNSDLEVGGAGGSDTEIENESDVPSDYLSPSLWCLFYMEYLSLCLIVSIST